MSKCRYDYEQSMGGPKGILTLNMHKRLNTIVKNRDYDHFSSEEGKQVEKATQMMQDNDIPKKLTVKTLTTTEIRFAINLTLCIKHILDKEPLFLFDLFQSSPAIAKPFETHCKKQLRLIEFCSQKEKPVTGDYCDSRPYACQHLIDDYKHILDNLPIEIANVIHEKRLDLLDFIKNGDSLEKITHDIAANEDLTRPLVETYIRENQGKNYINTFLEILNVMKNFEGQELTEKDKNLAFEILLILERNNISTKQEVISEEVIQEQQLKLKQQNAKYSFFTTGFIIKSGFVISFPFLLYYFVKNKFFSPIA